MDVKQPLRVGFAGYGVVGKRRREIIDRRDDMRAAAVSDVTLGGDGKFDDGTRYYADFRRLADEDLDILFVCLPNDIAPEATIMGLESGFHVFCEKPPGRDLADVARVMACESRHPGCKLKYGFNHRYHDSVRDALDLIVSGEFGRMVNLRGVYGKSMLISFGQTTWRTQRELSGGGILLDQGIHMVDLMRLFAGEFTDIHSFVRNDYWNQDVEDNAYALMRTADGVIGMLHSSATQWRHRFNLEITMERGSLTLSGILSGSKSYGAEMLTVAWAGDDNGDPPEKTTRYNADNSWREEIEDFVDAILGDQPITVGSSKDAFQTMELVYRIYCADPEWRDRWQLTHKVSE